MGSLIIVLIAVAIYCGEAYCDTFPIIKPEDTGLDERNDSHTIEKGVFWKNLDLSRRKPTKMEKSRNLNNMSSEASKRKSRFLSSLAFLAGLSFGGLATAASSTMKSIAKIPRGSFSLNLGSSKTSPYIAAYYSPYSVIPYPFFYHGHIGLVPMIDPAKPQTLHNDLKPQVISLFDNRQPIDLEEDNEEYASAENNDKSVDKNEEADDRTDSRGETDRNAEEKTTIHKCKGGQQKRGNFFKGSAREREDLHVDADGSPGRLNFQAANMTVTDANQVVTQNSTMTTELPQNTTHHHHHHHHHHNHTEHPPFPGYFGGYPQNINHVDLTTDSNAYYYQDHGPINYNLPYERPANFYHDGKYNVYSNPPANPHYSGPFLPDQINEYAGTDFNRFYQSNHQPSYSDSFKPVK